MSGCRFSASTPTHTIVVKFWAATSVGLHLPQTRLTCRGLVGQLILGIIMVLKFIVLDELLWLGLLYVCSGCVLCKFRSRVSFLCRNKDVYV